MKQLLQRGAVLGAAAAIGLLAACAADQTTAIVGGGAGAAPSVDVIATNMTTDGINISQPVAVQVFASGERAIRRVTLDVMSGTRRLGGLDSVLATPTASVTLSANVALVGVTVGQQIELRAVARDVRNIAGGDTTRVTTVANSTGGGDTTGTGGGGTGTPTNAAPRVRIDSPSDTALLYAGRTIPIRVTAVDTNGVLRVDFSVRGAGFTEMAYTFRAATAPAPDSVTREQIIDIPATAVLDSVITVTATAIDGLSAASAPVVRRFTVRVQPADSTAPLVYQRVAGRLEDSSTIVIRASDASPIRKLGYQLLDSVGNVISTDSVYRAAGARRTLDSQVFVVRFPAGARGQLAGIIGFAEDSVASVNRVNRGWTVLDNAIFPATTARDAQRSYAVLVYGRTLRLSSGSRGADIAVDTVEARRVVYVSNITRNRLDVFSYRDLAPLPAVAVGSEPWGLHLDAARGDLLVGNSGGTNISRVDLGTRAEVGRYNTPNTRAWQIIEQIDDRGVVRMTAEEFNYSDRPQFVARSASGYVYYSTKPTTEATPGTIRRFTPGGERNLQQLWQYGDRAPAGSYGVIDADEVVIIKGVGQNKSDEIVIYDHRATDTGPMTISTRDSNTVRATAVLRAMGGDVTASDVDVESLALTDTTFAAVGGDGRWIGFGEGNRSPSGRVMLFADVFRPGNEVSATPGVSVLDLTNNASDQVFGLAINRNSSTVAVQGGDAFYAGIDDNDFRFQLRLQGRYVTPGNGSGVAFHPLNDGTQSTAAPNTRATFVAGTEPVVDIVDSYFYRLRGQLPIRAKLYGPIRAVLPTAAEQGAGIAVKLFGLTAEGLVVIDVRNSDIDNVPPAALRR